MKFSIKKEILLESLNIVSHAISSKNIIPVLGGIKYDLKKDGLYLEASDNEIDIKTFIDKKMIDKIDKEGTIVVQGKYLLDIVRKLPDTVINIEVIDGLKILIHTENSKFNLNGIDSDEFPDIKIEKSSSPISISKKLIKQIVNQTIFATSTQETRPILTGINFKINGDEMEVVATDSYRLAKKTIKLDKAVDNVINIVVPSKNIGELIKIIDESDDNLNIHIFTNKILFEMNDIYFQSRLLNGNFPDINRLIPTEYKLVVKASTNDLYDVVDRASLLTSEKEKNVIKFEISENELIVTSNTPEIGKVEERLSILNESGNDLSISFSAKYMLEALRTISSKEVKISLNGEINPIILTNEENDDLIQLLLPIKTY
jgi:DNA polymerase-3 subunit beta